ncbi:Hypothetical predicted protein [Cloeon dipterum]|uniref:Uncharacterized protein n=1 Tax=Cloeon dipterum TaxID=197152 RepID=A0A8S1CIQ8_9INSE|nr:Hypothetical predicted protein [Cloeon dipterum]
MSPAPPPPPPVVPYWRPQHNQFFPQISYWSLAVPMFNSRYLAAAPSRAPSPSPLKISRSPSRPRRHRVKNAS